MPLLLSLSSLLSMPLLLYFWPGRAKNRGDSRFTFVHETAGSRLLFQLFPQRVEFTGDRVLRLVRPGRYANTRALQKLRNVGGSICYPCPTRQINHTVGAFDRLVFDFVGIDRDSRRTQRCSDWPNSVVPSGVPERYAPLLVVYRPGFDLPRRLRVDNHSR